MQWPSRFSTIRLSLTPTLENTWYPKQIHLALCIGVRNVRPCQCQICWSMEEPSRLTPSDPNDQFGRTTATVSTATLLSSESVRSDNVGDVQLLMHLRKKSQRLNKTILKSHSVPPVVKRAPTSLPRSTIVSTVCTSKSMLTYHSISDT